jgi:transcriptional regulator with XRE-family HTH domain
MILGERLRALRDEKNLSQGDIEKKTSLLRCYVSRVENGHTVPSVETLEKMARALEIPMYKLFYDSEEPLAQFRLLREMRRQNLDRNDSVEPRIAVAANRPFADGCGLLSHMSVVWPPRPAVKCTR